MFSKPAGLYAHKGRHGEPPNGKAARCWTDDKYAVAFFQLRHASSLTDTTSFERESLDGTSTQITTFEFVAENRGIIDMDRVGSMGGSNKAGHAAQAGQYGEGAGLKVGALAGSTKY